MSSSQKCLKFYLKIENLYYFLLQNGTCLEPLNELLQWLFCNPIQAECELVAWIKLQENIFKFSPALAIQGAALNKNRMEKLF